MSKDTTPSKRRIVHMPVRLWKEATASANALGLSTSQFLAYLVEEAVGALDLAGLLVRSAPEYK